MRGAVAELGLSEELDVVRIEVLRSECVSGKMNPRPVWWPCSLSKVCVDHRHHDGKPVWMLRSDAFEADSMFGSYPSMRAQVCLMSPTTLEEYGKLAPNMLAMYKLFEQPSSWRVMQLAEPEGTAKPYYEEDGEKVPFKPSKKSVLEDASDGKHVVKTVSIANFPYSELPRRTVKMADGTCVQRPARMPAAMRNPRQDLQPLCDFMTWKGYPASGEPVGYFTVKAPKCWAAAMPEGVL